MKTKTYFAFRIDVWDATGDNLVEHLAGLDKTSLAAATRRVLGTAATKLVAE
jgi:hypothetical protein